VTTITYERLFAYLKQLRFEDSSPSEFERVFKHPELGMVLAFSMHDDAAENRPVRGSDFTSAEFRLNQAGLLTGALAQASLRFSET
jgi:hypothetical protein